MGIVDIHTHLPTRQDVVYERNLPLLEAGGVKLGSRPPVEALIGEMDRGGIDVSVVLGSLAEAGIEHDNESLAKTIRPYEGRLVGFGIVDPRTEKDVAGAVRHLIEDLGFRGIGEYGMVPYSSPEHDPLYEACIDLDIPILFHTGVPLPAVPMRYGHPSLLDEVVIRYPELKVIAAHCGVPWIMELAAVAVRHPNVWVDVSALPAWPYPVRYLALGAMMAARVGDRLLFGSDFPVVRPSKWARWVRSFELPLAARAVVKAPPLGAEGRKAMLEGNARALLGL